LEYGQVGLSVLHCALGLAPGTGAQSMAVGHPRGCSQPQPQLLENGAVNSGHAASGTAQEPALVSM
jgi:hypothetical protein